MHVILYKRHKANCPHRDDKIYRRCRCSVWMEYNVDGVQTRKSAKTFSWDTAGDKARAIEQAHLDAELGRGPALRADGPAVRVRSVRLDPLRARARVDGRHHGTVHGAESAVPRDRPARVRAHGSH